MPALCVCVCVCVCVYVCVSRSVMSNSMRPHGLQPSRLLCPWDSPDKDTAVGCHFLHQGNLPDLEIKPTSPALAGRFFTTEPLVKPRHTHTHTYTHTHTHTLEYYLAIKTKSCHLQQRAALVSLPAMRES